MTSVFEFFGVLDTRTIFALVIAIAGLTVMIAFTVYPYYPKDAKVSNDPGILETVAHLCNIAKIRPVPVYVRDSDYYPIHVNFRRLYMSKKFLKQLSGANIQALVAIEVARLKLNTMLNIRARFYGAIAFSMMGCVLVTMLATFSPSGLDRSNQDSDWRQALWPLVMLLPMALYAFWGKRMTLKYLEEADSLAVAMVGSHRSIIEAIINLAVLKKTFYHSLSMSEVNHRIDTLSFADLEHGGKNDLDELVNRLKKERHVVAEGPIYEMVQALSGKAKIKIPAVYHFEIDDTTGIFLDSPMLPLAAMSGSSSKEIVLTNGLLRHYDSETLRSMVAVQLGTFRSKPRAGLFVAMLAIYMPLLAYLTIMSMISFHGSAISSMVFALGGFFVTAVGSVFLSIFLYKKFTLTALRRADIFAAELLGSSEPVHHATYCVEKPE